jgi:hypothetical protein
VNIKLSAVVNAVRVGVGDPKARVEDVPYPMLLVN